MISQKMERTEAVFSIFFYGSLWGIGEATLGFVLHLCELTPGVSGGIMFPLAFYFMRKAYFETGRLSSIFFTASVASLIKLSDLLLPHLRPIKTLNPVLAIMIEAGVVFALFAGLKRKGINVQGEIKFPHILLSSLSWRVLYLSFSIPIFIFFSDGFIKYGTQGSVQFLTWGTLLNTGMVYAYLKLNQLQKSEWFFQSLKHYRPIIGTSTLIAAFFIERILTLWFI